MQRLARQDFAGSIEAFEALLAQRRTPARLCSLAASELGEFGATVPRALSAGAGAAADRCRGSGLRQRTRRLTPMLSVCALRGGAQGWS